MTTHPASVRSLWDAYCEASSTDPGSRLDVFAFGDSPAMSDELAALVRTGPKRATAGSLADMERDEEAVPVVDGHAVIVDGAGEAVCVIRTTEVTVKPLNQVDAAFAWDEGEGDRTLEWWLDAHRSYFSRGRAARGETFSDDELCVFERFALVWPVAAPES